jgi:hypothetical protein
VGDLVDQAQGDPLPGQVLPDHDVSSDQADGAGSGHDPVDLDRGPGARPRTGTDRWGGGPAGRAPSARSPANVIGVCRDGIVRKCRPARLTWTVTVSIQSRIGCPARAGPIQNC